jgi:hypothetical protein
MTNAAAPQRAPRRRAPTSARSPLDELRADGRLGPEGAKHLYRTVRTVALGHGFPPPSDYRHWDADATMHVAHDFVSDARTPRRLAHLVVSAHDDGSFDRLLYRMVLNFLRDAGRRTEVGRLMLRLRDVLGASDQFAAEPGDRWRLASGPSSPSSVPAPALADSASREPHVDTPRWSPQTRRRPPVADAPSLERLCRRALEAAAGTVPLAQLAQSIAPRLGIAPIALGVPVDDREPLDRVPGPQRADSTLDGMRAAEIFAILSERERLLLSAAGTPVRALRSVIGVGPSQAAELQARLREVLSVELRDDDRYEAVVFHLVDQAKAWARRRAAGQPDAMRRLVDAR